MQVYNHISVFLQKLGVWLLCNFAHLNCIASIFSITEIHVGC